MIEKIIADGRPGIATAILDVAIKLGLACGGWSNTVESTAEKYGLTRLPGASRQALIERAVQAAQGTLYFVASQTASLELELVKKSAMRLNRPLLIQDLTRESGFSASRRIATWIDENRIQVLHVDGQGEGQPLPSAAARAAKILEAAFFLTMMGSGVSSPLPSFVEKARQPGKDPSPQTLEAALIHLEQSLSLKERATIANLTAGELVSLHFTLGDYINTHFDLYSSTSDLRTDCRRWSGQPDLAPEDAAAVIIRALWERLRATCRIRIVK